MAVSAPKDVHGGHSAIRSTSRTGVRDLGLENIIYGRSIEKEVRPAPHPVLHFLPGRDPDSRDLGSARGS
jgi:hypothetical protein